jgi:hypothetical protein
MQMPDFDHYRYIAISPEPFSAHWIQPKGRLREASQAEVESLGPQALELIESPEAVGLNYQGRVALAIYRVVRAA